MLLGIRFYVCALVYISTFLDCRAFYYLRPGQALQTSEQGIRILTSDFFFSICLNRERDTLHYNEFPCFAHVVM